MRLKCVLIQYRCLMNYDMTIYRCISSGFKALRFCAFVTEVMASLLLTL